MATRRQTGEQQMPRTPARMWIAVVAIITSAAGVTAAIPTIAEFIGMSTRRQCESRASVLRSERTTQQAENNNVHSKIIDRLEAMNTVQQVQASSVESIKESLNKQETLLWQIHRRLKD